MHRWVSWVLKEKERLMAPNFTRNMEEKKHSEKQKGIVVHIKLFNRRQGFLPPHFIM